MFIVAMQPYRLMLGYLADALTFLGAAILARDSLQRLRELKHSRIDVEFRKHFPKLRLTDEELQQAIRSTRWNVAGFSLLCVGFLSQVILRHLD